MSELIPVANGADYLEVHPTTLASHKSAGWSECERREAADAPTSRNQRKAKAANAAEE